MRRMCAAREMKIGSLVSTQVSSQTSHCSTSRRTMRTLTFRGVGSLHRGAIGMRLIDLSALIAPTPPRASPFSRVEIQRTSHAEGAAQVQTGWAGSRNGAGSQLSCRPRADQHAHGARRGSALVLRQSPPRSRDAGGHGSGGGRPGVFFFNDPTHGWTTRSFSRSGFSA